MARFNFNKPTADYTDDELREMASYKPIRDSLQGKNEEEVFRLMLRNIDGRRNRHFAKLLQRKTKDYIEFLNKRGFMGREWAIQLVDDGSYSLTPLRDYVSSDAPIIGIHHLPQRLQPKAPKKVIQASAGRKITRNYAPEDNYTGRKTMSGIIDEAKKKGQAAAKKKEGAAQTQKPLPLSSPTCRGHEHGVEEFIQSGSIKGAVACPDLECSGLMSRAGKVQGTKGLPAWYCEVCNKHYVLVRPPGKSEHFITLERFLEWIKSRKIIDAKQAKKRAEKESDHRKWELVTWEQVEAWRRANHITKSEVAKMAGVCRDSFYKWGQGVNIPTLASQKKLKDLISQPLEPSETPWNPRSRFAV